MFQSRVPVCPRDDEATAVAVAPQPHSSPQGAAPAAGAQLQLDATLVRPARPSNMRQKP